MAKIIVSSMVSIDGYTEGADGDVSRMPMDLAFAEHNADRVRSAGRILFGGTTYRGMMQYWPNQVDNPDAIPEDRYVASRYATEDDDIIVFGSRTLWTDLLANGLVDELHLLVGPKVVAGDERAFEGLPQIEFTLIGARTWKDSSTVVLSYRPGNAAAPEPRGVDYN